MTRFFAPYRADRCCLCGSAESLTGEHKVKASALRTIFGSSAMVIGSFDGTAALRPAQGPKSRAFHFSARMCSACNSSRTQATDREFDRFHALVTKTISEGQDPASIFDLPQYELGSEPYLNVFRYFAKLLCCHVAESCGPRSLAVGAFSTGDIKGNPVFLTIDMDPTYTAVQENFGVHQYAAHGGLIVPIDSDTELPTCFQSSLSLGVVRYKFWVRFGAAVGEEIKTHHPDFWRKCHNAYLDALKNPLTDEQRHRRGI